MTDNTATRIAEGDHSWSWAKGRHVVHPANPRILGLQNQSHSSYSSFLTEPKKQPNPTDIKKNKNRSLAE